MNVYLACTVRGDRCGVGALRQVADLLRARGHHVLTSHLLEDDVDTAESQLTERQVFERDLEWLSKGDVLVAEASGSTFGVGFEVGYFLGSAREGSRSVLLLYDAARRGQISRLIVGNSHPRCVTYGYAAADDLLRRVAAFIDAQPAA